MFTQHLIKNCLWLLAAVQCFSPPHLSRFLVVVMTTFMLQIGFANGVFAEDVATTTDTPVTSPTEPTSVDATVVPSIRFVLNEDNSVSLEVTGVDLDSEVSGFTFENSDITPLINQMISSGTMQEQSEPTKRTFVLKFSIENPQSLEGGLFGISLTNGSILSTRVKLESTETGKAATVYDWKIFNQLRNDAIYAAGTVATYFNSSKAITYVDGTFKQRNPRGCSPWRTWKCYSDPIKNTLVSLYIMGSNGTGGEVWSKLPIGTTTTDELGYYKFSQISYCGPVRVILNGYTPPMQQTSVYCGWNRGISFSKTWD